MSTYDPFVALSAEFDRPVAPRPEFAAALGERLLAELRSAPIATDAPRSTSWVWSVLSARPKTRLVLAVVVMLLLLVGVATATYLGAQSWIGMSPRGAQARNGYRLTTVYSTPRSAWMDNYPAAAVSADGGTVFLAHESAAGAAEILGVSRSQTGAPARVRQILDFRTIPDFLLATGAAWGGLATSPNGDLFVIAASGSQGPLAMSAIVVRPDGSRQTVVTYRELRRSGLIPPGVPAFASDDGSFSIAASAPDRLWLRARTLWRPYSSGWPYDVTNALFEITDPNGDDDWSDRVVRRVALPGSVPGFHGRSRSAWWYGALVAEPSLTGDGRSTSVLLQATGLVGKAGSRRSVLSVVRVNDRNWDGDATDPGEVVPVFRAPVPTPVQLTSRVNISGGRARRELVIAGLTRPDRVTVVTSSGHASDIGRSFSGWGSFDALLADAQGDIFPVVGVDGAADGMQRRIFELQPSSRARPAVATLKPRPIPAPPGGGPLLAITTAADGSPAVPGTSYWIRPDGSDRVVVALHAGDLCQSSVGSTLAFTSDLEVPQEGFVYTATLGGGVPTKVSEQALTPTCPFDGLNLVLASRAMLPDGPMWTLWRHDVRNGRTAPVVAGTSRFEISPDGHMLAYVEHGPTGDSLVTVDLRTMSRRHLARARSGQTIAPSTKYAFLENGSVPDDLQWSPDGSRLAFVTGKPFDFGSLSWSAGDSPVQPRRYTISTVRLRDDHVRTIARLTGGSPSLYWSPDGTKLLACAATRGPESGCGDHTTRGVYFPDSDTESVVHLLDLHGGDRIVAHGLFVYAGWRPRTKTYAWADDVSLHLSTTSDATRLFSAGGAWLGWSPDGRYIALGPEDRYAVIDTRTGRRRALVYVPQEYMIRSVSWWRAAERR